MNDEELLAEVEDLLRTTPPQLAFKKRENDEALSWLGRTGAVLEKWDLYKTPDIHEYIRDLQTVPRTTRDTFHGRRAYSGIRTLLFQAQHDLRMKTVGPLSVAISGGKPFDYFDEIRKIIEMARNDLLFVDPYLDAEFVSRYLLQVNEGVTVRLLASKKISSLVPVVEIFVKQSGLRVEVRSAASVLHDRYVFVDEERCYQSGASFKDGAKTSQTTLTQITDAFETMLQTYQRMWGNAKVVTTRL